MRTSALRFSDRFRGRSTMMTYIRNGLFVVLAAWLWSEAGSYAVAQNPIPTDPKPGKRGPEVLDGPDDLLVLKSPQVRAGDGQTDGKEKAKGASEPPAKGDKVPQVRAEGAANGRTDENGQLRKDVTALQDQVINLKQEFDSFKQQQEQNSENMVKQLQTISATLVSISNRMSNVSSVSPVASGSPASKLVANSQAMPPPKATPQDCAPVIPLVCPRCHSTDSWYCTGPIPWSGVAIGGGTYYSSVGVVRAAMPCPPTYVVSPRSGGCFRHR